MKIRAILGALILLVSGQVNAALIQYDFSGTVRHIPSGIFGSYYLEIASGFFSYDTSWDSVGGIVPSGSGERESYLATNQNWSFMLVVGGYTFDSSPINTSNSPGLSIQNNGTFSDTSSDLIWDQFSYHNNTDDNFHWQIGLSEYLIQPDIPDAFKSTELPPDLYLADFNSHFALIRGQGSEIRVDIESLSRVSPVPIPAAVWLFGTGLLGLIGVKWRRKAE